MKKMLTGHAAIDHVAAHGGNLGKFADPTEDARYPLTLAEARDVAAEDPGLIYWVSDERGDDMATTRERCNSQAWYQGDDGKLLCLQHPGSICGRCGRQQQPTTSRTPCTCPPRKPSPNVGHTPGPWSYQHQSGTYFIHSERSYDFATTRTEANARLIAAAPEMLALLRTLACVADNDGPLARAYQRECDEARALLTRVDGS